MSTQKKFDRSKIMSSLVKRYINVDDILGGTESMQAAGQKYLFKEPKESDINYKLRLRRTTLFPAYSRSVKNAVGKVYTKPLKVELPEILQEMRWNVDGAGQSMEAFAKDVTEKAIHYGITYIFVDYPKSTAESLADERNLNNNPYFVQITPLEVLEINTQWINNKLTLTYVRFFEDFYEDGEYHQQVKELTLNGSTVEYAIYRKDKKDQEYLHDTGVMSGIDAIPLVPVYGKKIAPYHGTPSLYDLYELNVAHWRAYSDFMNITHYSQVPMLKVKGLTPEYDDAGQKQDVIISSNTVFDLPAEGDVAWVEVSGNASKVGQELLKDLEQKMAVIGLQLFMNTSERVTATENILDAAEEQSMLKSIVIDIEYALNEALVIAAIFKGVNTELVSLTIDSSYTVTNNSDFKYVMDMYNAGIVTAEDVLSEARNRNIFKQSES